MRMKSIGNIIHTKTFPLNIIDSRGDIVYFENIDGQWWKEKYDNGHEIHFEDSSGIIIRL